MLDIKISEEDLVGIILMARLNNNTKLVNKLLKYYKGEKLG